MVLDHVRGADYRHALAREAARHKLKVRVIDRQTVTLEL